MPTKYKNPYAKKKKNNDILGTILGANINPLKKKQKNKNKNGRHPNGMYF